MKGYSMHSPLIPSNSSPSFFVIGIVSIALVCFSFTLVYGDCTRTCTNIQDSVERLRCYDQCAQQGTSATCEPLCEAVRLYVSTCVRLATLPPARGPIERQERDKSLDEAERLLQQAISSSTAKAPHCRPIAAYIEIWKPRFSLEVQAARESFFPVRNRSQSPTYRSVEEAGTRLVEDVCRRAATASGQVR